MNILLRNTCKVIILEEKVLIQKLVKEGIKERKCELCGLKEWQNQEIPLEVHHIDGNTF